MAPTLSATAAAPRRVKPKAAALARLDARRLPLILAAAAIAGTLGYFLQFEESPLVMFATAAYIVAAALYATAMVRGGTTWAPAASAAAVVGLLVQTAGIASRWAIAGRPPFSNMYEMLLSFAWAVALLHVIFERKYGASYSGVLAMPVTALAMVLVQFMDASVRPLVPALQSSLLHVHVSLAVISYAAFALSFATALLYLAKDGIALEVFAAWTSGLAAFIYAAVLGAFFRGGKLILPAWDAVNRQKVFFERNSAVHVAISGLGWMVLVGFVAAVLPLTYYLWFGKKRFADKLGVLIWLSLAGQALATGLVIYNFTGGPYPALEVPDSFVTSPVAVPFVIPGLLVGIMGLALVLLFSGRWQVILDRLPAAERLDRLTYRIIQVGLPLLTLMIVTGAFWANRAWGAYWSWDPKEDWALITWFTYAAYLHTRLLKGWRGRRSAYFAIVGFVVVLFTFFGVSYLLSGLHSYAS